jgi:hypothetical protein
MRREVSTPDIEVARLAASQHGYVTRSQLLDAVLSHRSAAALWGLVRWPPTLELTAPTDRRVPGVHTHRSRNLEHVTTHYGIPTTTPARTLLDLAEVLDPTSLTRAVNDARLRRLMSLDDLHELITHSPGRATRARARRRAAVRVTWRRLIRAEHREAARFSALLTDCRTTRG